MPLQFPPNQQVELLVGAAEFHIRAQCHGVVALRQRIEHLMQKDRLFVVEPAMEFLALQHLRDSKSCSQADNAFESQGR